MRLATLPRTAGLAGLAGLLGAGALVLGGCGIGTHHTYSDDNAVSQRITSVRVDGTSALRLHTGERTAVHRTVRYAENDPGKDTFRVDGDALVLQGCPHVDCSVDYDVTVPAGIPLAGHSGSGDVDVAGLSTVSLSVDSGDVTIRQVSGVVNLETGSGTTTLADVGGAVTVRSGSGEVQADRLRAALTVDGGSGAVTASAVGGPVKVDADSGDVTLTMADAQDVSAKSSSGAVQVTVPRAAYRLVTGTDSGDVTAGVPNDPAGAHLLDLHSNSGDISVRYG